MPSSSTIRKQTTALLVVVLAAGCDSLWKGWAGPPPEAVPNWPACCPADTTPWSCMTPIKPAASMGTIPCERQVCATSEADAVAKTESMVEGPRPPGDPTKCVMSYCVRGTVAQILGGPTCDPIVEADAGSSTCTDAVASIQPGLLSDPCGNCAVVACCPAFEMGYQSAEPGAAAQAAAELSCWLDHADQCPSPLLPAVQTFGACMAVNCPAYCGGTP